MINGTTTQEQGHVPHKNPGVGIASFVIALVQGIITAAVLVIAGVLAITGSDEDHEMGFMLIGFALIGGILVHLVGVGLGIAGVVQKTRKKTFSILGLIINAGAILVVVLLMIIGVTAG